MTKTVSDKLTDHGISKQKKKSLKQAGGLCIFNIKKKIFESKK
jgi:hypothetical protein